MSSRVGVVFEGSAGSVVAASREAAAAVQTVTKSVGASTVETVKSSSAYKGLAKSVALTSAAFLGGAGLIAVVKESIGQAETLQKAHASLDVSVTRLGGNFKIASGEIDTWAAKQAKFGVTITASEQGLARLIPLTGSVTTAMKTYSEALELSKGDNIDLSAAETAVAKANDGKTTSLQRYGIVLAKNASQEQIAAAISKRFGGQAAANTTTLDQLKATLGNVGLTLGQDMLPQIEHLAGGLEGWFSNQQNVNRVTSDAKQVIDDTVTVIQTTYNWAEKITGALGGWKDSLELIGAAWAAVKIAGWVTSLARLTTALFGVRDAEVAVNAANPFAALAVAAGLAATEIIQHWKQVNDVINGTPGQSPQYTTPAQNAYSKGGRSVFEANGVYYQRTAGAAYPQPITKKAYDAFASQQGVTLNTTLAHPGAIAPAKVQAYLMAAGLPSAAAAVLAGIDVHGENSTGNLTAMNVNKNGTYDYGLFQINSSHKPSTMTDAQWKAYLANPANNAKEAVSILNAQGFGAWTEKYGAAAAAEYPKGSAAWNLLMGSDLGGSIPVGDGGATKKTTVVRGTALIPSDLNDAIKTLADKAKNAAGAAAAADLKAEEDAVEKAIGDVGAKLSGASPKQAAAINSEISSLKSKLNDLQTAVKDAAASKDIQAIVANAAATLKSEQAENKSLTDKATTDAAAAIKSNLAGAAKIIVDDYTSIGQNLAQQQQTLLSSQSTLTARLAGADKTIASQIKSQVAKINTELGNVATAIQSNLQSEQQQLQQAVDAAASSVSSTWSSVQSDIVSEFEKQTNDYIQNVLGPQFFQGSQTPAEAQLASMQAQDQVDQLNASLASAQASGDAGQIAQAQRAIAEYQLSIQATQQRADADKEYAAAVQQYTDQRTVEEHKLSIALDAFGQGLADNKGNLSDLSDLLAQYGIPTMAGLSDVAGQLYAIDFPALSKSVGNLQAATDALTTIEWQLYGKMGGTGGGGSDAPPALAGSYSVGGGYTPYIQRALPGLPVALAGGGTIRVPGRFIGRDSVPALLSPGETVIDRRMTAALEQLLTGGGGGSNVTVNATVLGATEGQVGSALERLTTPAGKRVVSYPAPRL